MLQTDKLSFFGRRNERKGPYNILIVLVTVDTTAAPALYIVGQ